MDYQVRKSYWKFIEDEAKRLGSDGCTGVSDWHRECCWEHDLACHYGKNPRDAYAAYCEHPNIPTDILWKHTNDMTRREADIAFGKCNWEWSPNTQGKLRSIIRFLGVRLGAYLGIGVRQPKELTLGRKVA